MNDARVEKAVDQMIGEKNAQFVRQLHVLRPVLDKLATNSILEPVHPLLLLPYIREYDGGNQIVNGHGLRCRSYGPRTLGFEITIKKAAEKVGDHPAYKNSVVIESDEWKEMIANGDIKENAVVSLWVFYDRQSSATSSPKAKTGVIFRLDGYAEKNEPPPAIPHL